jgi:hypothetical protein
MEFSRVFEILSERIITAAYVAYIVSKATVARMSATTIFRWDLRKLQSYVTSHFGLQFSNADTYKSAMNEWTVFYFNKSFPCCESW